MSLHLCYTKVDQISVLPVASLPLAVFVMTTLDDTVVGVLAAMTKPMRTSEFMDAWSLKNRRTTPNTKNGMITRLII